MAVSEGCYPPRSLAPFIAPVQVPLLSSDPHGARMGESVAILHLSVVDLPSPPLRVVLAATPGSLIRANRLGLDWAGSAPPLGDSPDRRGPIS